MKNSRTPTRVTGSPDRNDQLLYFTSPSLLSDDRQLIFLSDRSGAPNIFWRDLATAEERQLTFNREGFLKSYVYFDGIPYRGLGKASISVHPATGIIYFIQGREIRSVDTFGRQRVLAEYPPGQMTAFTHVSADGSRLCVPTVDERALDGERIFAEKPDYDIDARVQAEGLSSYLRVYDIATGREIACERVPNAWVTHVQFAPTNSDVILYNHEWASHSAGTRRMWLWDGREHRRLRPESDGCSPEDWACHEMWERNGEAIIYHGSYAGGDAFIGRVFPDGSKRIEITLPSGWKRYGHFTVGAPGRLISDGYYEQPGDGTPSWAGAWISVLDVDWQAKHIDWSPQCTSSSSWASQDVHPHPVFNHAADTVYFTSDVDGKSAIYCIRITDS